MGTAPPGRLPSLPGGQHGVSLALHPVTKLRVERQRHDQGVQDTCKTWFLSGPAAVPSLPSASGVQWVVSGGWGRGRGRRERRHVHDFLGGMRGQASSSAGRGLGHANGPLGLTQRPGRLRTPGRPTGLHEAGHRCVAGFDARRQGPKSAESAALACDKQQICPAGLLASWSRASHHVQCGEGC